MTRTKFLGLLLAVFSYSGVGQTTPLFNNVGLVGSSRVLTFSEVVLSPPGSPVTIEYAGFGVTFFPRFFYDS
jgi:hypothetical protein